MNECSLKRLVFISSLKTKHYVPLKHSQPSTKLEQHHVTAKHSLHIHQHNNIFQYHTEMQISTNTLLNISLMCGI